MLRQCLSAFIYLPTSRMLRMPEKDICYCCCAKLSHSHRSHNAANAHTRSPGPLFDSGESLYLSIAGFRLLRSNTSERYCVSCLHTTCILCQQCFQRHHCHSLIYMICCGAHPDMLTCARFDQTESAHADVPKLFTDLESLIHSRMYFTKRVSIPHFA